MASTTNEERETSIYQNMADKSNWNIITEDPAIMRKLTKLGANHIRTLFGGAEEYTIRANQLSFRKGSIVERSEAQKVRDAINGQRLRDSRAVARAEGEKMALGESEEATE